MVISRKPNKPSRATTQSASSASKKKELSADKIIGQALSTSKVKKPKSPSLLTSRFAAAAGNPTKPGVEKIIKFRTKGILLSFKKNLSKILARKGIPALHYGRQKWVSERYGVSTSAARKWLMGECLPDWDHMTLIADDNNVSIDELLGRKPFASSGASFTIPVKGDVGNGSVGVLGDVSFEEGLIKTAMRMQHNGVELRVVSTDCMAPSINENDVAFVDTELTKLKDNRIYLFSANGRVLYRRVMYQMDGSIVLSCENSNYQSQVVQAQDILSDDYGSESSPIKVVGEVVWIIKRISSQSVPVISLNGPEG